MNIALNLEKDDLAQHSWGHQYLDWFSTLGIPMVEKQFALGTLNYFHFACSFAVADGRRAHSFGSDKNRFVAALKCAAEAVERKTMVEYFSANPSVPRSLRNSNGWAVHHSVERAIQKAKCEAIERHLLLKAFFLLGWRGFNLVHEIKSADLELKLLLGQYTAGGIAAGLVMAKSPTVAGVSFGYSAGPKGNSEDASFWEPAIFEATDKIFSIEHISVDSAQGWIPREIGKYLTEPFQAVEFSGENRLVEEDIPAMESKIFDLGSKNGLQFPLFGAYARGESTIPLFWKAELDSDGMSYVGQILEKNGIALSGIPERHPVI